MPARVGRVSLVDGAAGFRTGVDWTDAQVNDPVTTGAAMRTNSGARAEMRIGVDTIDLAGASELAVAKLDGAVTQISLAQGRIGVRLPRLDDGRRVEIDVPRGGIWLSLPGRYDIDIGNGARPTRVTVLDGSARFVGAHADIGIAAGQTAALSGGDPVTASLDQSPADAFVEWCRTRDLPNVAVADAHRLPSDLTGRELLDTAGHWDTVAALGDVWYPADVAADWVPYRNGRWASVEPWGWTWIADEPWGFVPSHYGRWASIDGKWAWVPGSLAAHPAFAPALVAFLGTPGVGLSYPDAIGPAIAWFPLAPGEIYWPGYPHEPAVIAALNPGIADEASLVPGPDGRPPIALVNGKFANRLAATVVPRSIFVGGRPVQAALLSLPEQRLQDVPAIVGSPQIAAATPRRSPASARPRELPFVAAISQAMVSAAHERRPYVAIEPARRVVQAMARRLVAGLRTRVALAGQPPVAAYAPPGRLENRHSSRDHPRGAPFAAAPRSPRSATKPVFSRGPMLATRTHRIAAAAAPAIRPGLQSAHGRAHLAAGRNFGR